MRADKLLMLGVVSLGAFAVYKLTQTSSAAQAPPARSSGPPSDVALVTAPAELEIGQWYRGRLDGLPPGTSLRDLDALATSLGLGRARLFPSTESASAGGTPAWALADASPGSAWFHAKFNGPRPATFPRELALVWISRPAV